MIKKVSFAVWNNRIAPVFDVARQLTIIEIERNTIISEQIQDITFISVHDRGQWLKDNGINTLICGAVSKPLEEIIINSGIGVISFISGELEKVMATWIKNENLYERFAMPGCMRRQRNQFRGKVNPAGRGRMRKCRMG
jgi:predicted Fe-Mo cluster-binding NifX family protein